MGYRPESFVHRQAEEDPLHCLGHLRKRTIALGEKGLPDILMILPRIFQAWIQPETGESPIGLAVPPSPTLGASW